MDPDDDTKGETESPELTQQKQPVLNQEEVLEEIEELQVLEDLQDYVVPEPSNSTEVEENFQQKSDNQERNLKPSYAYQGGSQHYSSSIQDYSEEEIDDLETPVETVDEDLEEPKKVSDSSVEEVEDIGTPVEAPIDDAEKPIEGVDTVGDFEKPAEGVDALVDGFDAPVEGIRAPVEGVDGFDAPVEGVDGYVEGPKGGFEVSELTESASPDPAEDAQLLAEQPVYPQDDAAVKIQSAFRGHAQRQLLKKQEDSATRIQAVFRGHNQRVKLSTTLDIQNDEPDQVEEEPVPTPQKEQPQAKLQPSQIVQPKTKIVGAPENPKSKVTESKPKAPEIKPRVAEVKAKVAEVRPKAAEVKPKVTEVKAKVAEIKPRVAEVKPKLAEVRPKAAEVKPKVAEVKPRVAAPKLKVVEPTTSKVDPTPKPAETKTDVLNKQPEPIPKQPKVQPAPEVNWQPEQTPIQVQSNVPTNQEPDQRKTLNEPKGISTNAQNGPAKPRGKSQVEQEQTAEVPKIDPRISNLDDEGVTEQIKRLQSDLKKKEIRILQLREKNRELETAAQIKKAPQSKEVVLPSVDIAILQDKLNEVIKARAETEKLIDHREDELRLVKKNYDKMVKVLQAKKFDAENKQQNNSWKLEIVKRNQEIQTQHNLIQDLESEISNLRANKEKEFTAQTTKITKLEGQINALKLELRVLQDFLKQKGLDGALSPGKKLAPLASKAWPPRESSGTILLSPPRLDPIARQESSSSGSSLQEEAENPALSAPRVDTKPFKPSKIQAQNPVLTAPTVNRSRFQTSPRQSLPPVRSG